MVLSRDDGGEFRGTSLTGTSSGGLLRTSAAIGGLLRRNGLSSPSLPMEGVMGEEGLPPEDGGSCCWVPCRGRGGGCSPGRCLMVPTFSQANGRDSDETLDPLESFRRIRVPLGDSSPSDEEAELGVDMAGGGGGGKGACGASSSAPADDNNDDGGAATAGGGGGGRGGSSRVVAIVNLHFRGQHSVKDKHWVHKPCGTVHQVNIAWVPFSVFTYNCGSFPLPILIFDAPTSLARSISGRWLRTRGRNEGDSHSRT